jgi:hypothetical protein
VSGARGKWRVKQKRKEEREKEKHGLLVDQHEQFVERERREFERIEGRISGKKEQEQTKFLCA